MNPMANHEQFINNDMIHEQFLNYIFKLFLFSIEAGVHDI